MKEAHAFEICFSRMDPLRYYFCYTFGKEKIMHQNFIWENISRSQIYITYLNICFQADSFTFLIKVNGRKCIHIIARLISFAMSLFMYYRLLG